MKFFYSPKKQNEKGFTLAEILVVVVIFSLIVLAIYAIYLLSSRMYRQGEVAAEMNQNGRVMIERMTREIRQAKTVVTDLPETQINPPSEILFQDGHVPAVIESGMLQGSSSITVVLPASSSSTDDYYKDIFIQITGGVGSGQIRKVVAYNGATKVATIDASWSSVPSFSSYTIDSSYYYIHYYQDGANLMRRVIAYSFSGSPNNHVPYNATPPSGQTLQTQVLEDARIIGQYVQTIQFWGATNINILLTLAKSGKQVQFSTQVFGRNL